MRWQRLWEFNGAGALFKLCVVVLAWEVSAGAVLGTLRLLADVPIYLRVVGAAALVLPAAYMAFALISYVMRYRADRRLPPDV